MANTSVQEYHLDGLSCADCAAKLERNLAAIPGVTQAKLNFTAAKLTLSGNYNENTIIEEARRDGVRVIPAQEYQEADQKDFWLKNRRAIISGLAGLILGVGWLLHYALDMENTARYFYLACIVVGGWPVGRKALMSLSRFRLDMNVLMCVAVIGALLIGEWSEGATVAFLFSVSEALESYSMDRARKSIRKLMSLAPDAAVVIRDGVESTLPVKEIVIGDLLVVRPGEKIAMDGKIIDGFSSVDQSPITGESVPVDRGPGDEVFAGTINKHGSLQIKVTKLVPDNTLTKIIHLVEDAQSKRAPAQAFVDRFAAVYTPIVIALAFFIVITPPLLMGETWEPWIYRGLALLVVACPCALVIATPVAIVSAIGNAARHGVLVKGGVYLEEIGRLKALAFDKTGTLTKGSPTVTGLVPSTGVSRSQLLRIAASVEYHSEHPLARAIMRKAQDEEISLDEVRDFTALTGLGAKATLNGQSVLVGSPRLIEQKSIIIDAWKENIETLLAQGNTVILVSLNEEIIGAIALADTARTSGTATISELRQLGLNPLVMLTGDNAATAAVIAGKTGVDSYYANLLPQEKVSAIHELKEKHGIVGMVGDGINDAPALAASSVGIAMGGAGSDTSLETADVVLMGDDLSKLPFAITIGRSAMRVIKQNIFFAIGIKTLAVLAVFPGWLTLWLAIMADMGATILVTLNSIRLLSVQPSNTQQHTHQSCSNYHRPKHAGGG